MLDIDKIEVGKFDEISVFLKSGLILRGKKVNWKGGAFIAWGGREYTGNDGKKKTWPAIAFATRDMSDKFSAQVIAMIPESDGIPKNSPLASGSSASDDLPF